MTPKELFEKHNILNIGDLIHFIQIIGNSKYKGRSENNIRSFLSQTMSGERKLPIDLKESIILYFKHRNKKIDKELLSSEIVQVFNEAFIQKKKTKLDKQKSLKENALPGVHIARKNDFDLLRKYQERAITVTTITAEPAEVKNNLLADQLKHDLLEKIGVITTHKKRATYTFYLAQGPSYRLPIDFWTGLYRYALKLKIENIDVKFIEANKKLLKVYAVPDDEIDVTHGILDENTIDEISFITVYNQIVSENAFEDITVIREEKDNLYRVLRRLGKIRSLNPQEFPFAKALENITRQQ